MEINTNFIKVTRKGEEKAVICLASNKAHYLSIGAKVEAPTKEEVYKALGIEPEESEEPVADEQSKHKTRKKD